MKHRIDAFNGSFKFYPSIIGRLQQTFFPYSSDAVQKKFQKYDRISMIIPGLATPDWRIAICRRGKFLLYQLDILPFSG